MHHNMTTFESARAWIEQNWNSFPAAARPEVAQIEEFAHLFSSYLTTSFRIAKRRWVSNGCPCSFCSILIAPHLQAKQPQKLDREIAQKLKVGALNQLAVSLELPLFVQELERFISEKAELTDDVALLTWVIELLRRGEFRGQGEPVLALWREIAWKNGKPNPKFELDVSEVLEAEARIIAALKTYSF